jgi:hypothetical protein
LNEGAIKVSAAANSRFGRCARVREGGEAYFSWSRVVLVTRASPRCLAPTGPILLPIKLRREARKEREGRKG